MEFWKYSGFSLGFAERLLVEELLIFFDWGQSKEKHGSLSLKAER